MGWFNKREPVYSEVGTELYRLLTEEPEVWERTGYKRIQHLPSGVVYDHNPKYFYVLLNGERVNYISTVDDANRILRAGEELTQRLEEEFVRASKVVNQAILLKALKINDGQFDADCRSLARAVLKGDLVAARALADRVSELAQEAGS